MSSMMVVSKKVPSGAENFELGTREAGTWSVTGDAASTCLSYYFVGIDSLGQAWRYPDEGQFLIFGIGSCTEDYE